MIVHLILGGPLPDTICGMSYEEANMSGGLIAKLKNYDSRVVGWWVEADGHEMCEHCVELAPLVSLANIDLGGSGMQTNTFEVIGKMFPREKLIK